MSRGEKLSLFLIFWFFFIKKKEQYQQTLQYPPNFAQNQYSISNYFWKYFICLKFWFLWTSTKIKNYENEYIFYVRTVKPSAKLNFSKLNAFYLTYSVKRNIF